MLKLDPSPWNMLLIALASTQCYKLLLLLSPIPCSPCNAKHHLWRSSGEAMRHGKITDHSGCAGNVLLTSCAAQPHGFRAKISDFGLARNLSIQSKIETRTYGTITHMPLELLCDGIMSKVRS